MALPPAAVKTDDVEADRLRLQLRLALLQAQDSARENFIDFARYVWPQAIVGAHHQRIASAFDRVANGTLKRLIINLPPRHTKSEYSSYLLPAFIMGRKPDTKIIQATHTGELAVRFGRKVRNLMDTETYKEVFPDAVLKADSKAAGRWDTNHGGEYFAVGVGGAMTGRGANVLIIDDPHSEQDAMSPLALDNAWEWYTSGPRQRLQPGGAIVVLMTRWGTMDLTARLIKAQASHNADRWEVIEFPAIFDEGEPNERPLWPAFWKLEELRAVKASLSPQKWQAQWQQNPTSDDGAILKREWWKRWTKDYTPHLEYVIQSYDTAYSKKETADFSAITTWGVFTVDMDSGPSILLLNVKKGRWDFPQLKRIAKEEYLYWQPDNVLIEAKATGTTLQQELRRVGIPVTMYSPGGRRAGQDKVSRANSIATILESGMVWAPDTDWADELIEECAAFPKGDNDDLCLAEGSLILMADGSSCPVEQVRVGDRVATPIGAREVTASAYTGVRPVYEMSTAGGSVVLTGNHPIGTVGGWLTPDQLQNTRNSTIVMVSKTDRGYPWHGPQNQGLNGKRSALTVSSIVGILKAHAQHIAVILEGLVGSCTGMFGLFTRELSLRGTISTMWMRTQQITTYQTYSACPKNYTDQCNILDKKRMGVQKSNVSIWRQYVAKQPCGTHPLKGESGIDNTHRTASMQHTHGNHTQTLSRMKGCVLSVVKRFMPRVQRRCVVPKSVLTNAEGGLPVPRNLDKLGFANIAEGSFVLSRPEGNTVVTYANNAVIKPAGMHRVYNLSVAGAKCYFANGFLVHNCDSMIMALMRFRAGNFISLRDDEADKPKELGAIPDYY